MENEKIYSIKSSIKLTINCKSQIRKVSSSRSFKELSK